MWKLIRNDPEVWSLPEPNQGFILPKPTEYQSNVMYWTCMDAGCLIAQSLNWILLLCRCSTFSQRCVFPVYFWRRVIFPRVGQTDGGLTRRSAGAQSREATPDQLTGLWGWGWGSGATRRACVLEQPRCISVTWSPSSPASPNLETDRETQVAKKWFVINESSGLHHWMSLILDNPTCESDAWWGISQARCSLMHSWSSHFIPVNLLWPKI